ncbi:interleukin-13 receptor subunit alpha-2-like [Hyla sarda]|uniref:interleukin-13 receptor subunit alpha-2-like n=1 Tax=Hyla sarda TaxID=327740 RepID=UPI0024C3D606|nr:interleukin-13 receptor subunit alpha-2-like [Hyla sarda]XP_056396257.1 interleukin-13 receptor subunit alpha-2-like [Hyla sarda]XP_056396258.1 interleukin-13 receptor subunit alpha-2-like [Hyla sarda]XP_056396259.1 interleukin-13 receptor subunit alpha-2-like [Hyla sarda]XP_056396261.1 interleukin-13 receptor subunit alpha-2-like [Hyla sarda]XP_056396262.1 interleukin-13 receptor subunit alpha-2-like [Hyla sarda]XP_056396263.1 interleukin-13 receptor subunit alpha-2-like [Hyla sarda]XP_0
MCNLNHASLCTNMKRLGLQRISRFLMYSALYVQCLLAVEMTVDPPSNIQIEDLGTLGILEITWQPPASMSNMSECSAWYELTHQVVNEERWKSVRIKRQTYKEAFDLGKDIVIKIRTYLEGPCTEEREVWSEWVEINYPTHLQGTPETKVKDFKCINDKFETLICEWSAGELGSNSNYELQYWQEGMSEKRVCAHYMTENEINTGCHFGSEEFELFSDLFICVTEMPGMDPIRPSYFIFQLQNIGKPGVAENLTLTMDISGDFDLNWNEPKGKIPAHCLEYEIQSKNQMNMWETVAKQSESRYIFKRSETSNTCIRVRGKTNIYCADDGYWSEWSPELCWEEPSYNLGLKWLYCAVAVVIILTGLCVAASMYTVRMKRQWSKKLQYKAKELVYDIDPGHNSRC